MSDITYAPVQRQPRLAALVLLLQDVLRERGSVTFTVAHDLARDLYAETEFATNTVTFHPDLDLTEFAASAAHELIHLQRGPCRVYEVEAEESEVERLALSLLYGPDTSSLEPTRPQLVLLPGGAQ